MSHTLVCANMSFSKRIRQNEGHRRILNERFQTPSHVRIKAPENTRTSMRKRKERMGEASAIPTFDITELFLRHVDTVYRVCYSFLSSKAEAEDATQTVFMKLIDNPRDFEGVEHEKAWLIVCASNLCKDILKSARITRNAPLPDDAPDRFADPAAHAESSDVLDAIEALPPLYKDVVYLHYYEGYKTDEIARMLGSPPSTIRNRLSEARKLLRKAFEEEGPSMQEERTEERS